MPPDPVSTTAAQSAEQRSPALPLRWLARALAGIDHGELTLIDAAGNRVSLRGQAKGVAAVWRLRRPWRALFRLLHRGEIGFAEGYIAGDWGTPDLQSLLQFTMDNEHALTDLADRPAWQRQLDRFRHRLRRNSRRGSRAIIRFHYDLGNEFYRQWLDSTMSYSSALFSKGDEALETAQQRKYQRLLDRLDAEPGAHILEIGCGWGGFAEAAARRGYRVTGVTLSQEQLEYARERIARAGLSERVELRLQDYRDLSGQYDHVVSIEMFEAVGEEWWATYFDRLCQCLRPGGRAALQVITIDEQAFARYRVSADFIQLYVFPGGMLPPVRRFNALAGAAGLVRREQDFFGPDYALTLRRWFEEVRRSGDVIRALGYDDRFLRMWRYYLAYCETGFRSGRVDLMQVILQRRY
ncbi:S-adenosyl-L-methionine dependent methyltransferase, cyclopropane-fatty-acyl-phospholipid synthase - like protein [Thioalkalivibrio nitratireducens DSM 14787]|uniref:S-adenosyl-L-methionine dependent methyltransferase, cyclopropane-fatty-acyl-phospholipid synthase-like protein n=1 Tax=Thioalkalivibrio nitratireducens (strain DSM 14787 / UNIQEM 213 / ALEN2) TaxID=1255043 RepID=L0DZB7_THIND|nr:cyclopropane-fatty-acyl-phospholipid synthase family protein [Thioalkalivibrio nitratireducens]AGA34347.1 S-adenosyl-L-methionine dependent methyltransferase, cyclopropane-fatty-acyl-phospholipid synthase - like protein [Thioalkalivibrio nitratireducens DSM 14787]